MRKIEGSISGSINVEDIKRFYIDMIIKSTCPICSTECSEDLGDNYLSYPVIGQEKTLALYCEKCDDHFEIPIILKRVIATVGYGLPIKEPK